MLLESNPPGERLVVLYAREAADVEILPILGTCKLDLKGIRAIALAAVGGV